MLTGRPARPGGVGALQALIAQEIVEDLEAALAEFAAVAESLGTPPEPPSTSPK
ncbi:hypothetical protein BH18ACT13_BH18ACT13_21230 [soil metagenome]